MKRRNLFISCLGMTALSLSGTTLRDLVSISVARADESPDYNPSDWLSDFATLIPKGRAVVFDITVKTNGRVCLHVFHFTEVATRQALKQVVLTPGARIEADIVMHGATKSAGEFAYLTSAYYQGVVPTHAVLAH